MDETEQLVDKFEKIIIGCNNLDDAIIQLARKEIYLLQGVLSYFAGDKEVNSWDEVYKAYRKEVIEQKQWKGAFK